MSYSVSDYSNRVIDGQMCIWLQYHGWAAAKPAKDFKPGEFTLWNTGVSEKILSVAIQTEKTITFIIEYKGYGGKPEQSQRKFRKDRFVAIGSEKSY